MSLYKKFSSCAVGDRTTPPPVGGTTPPPAGDTTPPPAGGTTPPPAGGTPPKEGNGVRGLFDSPPVEGCRVAAGWFRRTSEVESQREQVNRAVTNYLNSIGE